jgi:hypothetical protein
MCTIEVGRRCVRISSIFVNKRKNLHRSHQRNTATSTSGPFVGVGNFHVFRTSRQKIFGARALFFPSKRELGMPDDDEVYILINIIGPLIPTPRNSSLNAGLRRSNDTTRTTPTAERTLQENLGAHHHNSRLFSFDTFRINMAPSSSPEGLQLIKGYRVGKCIGSGAQASVHLLEPTTKAKNASSSPLPTYAVKIAPVPTKITKKRLSVPEINERSISKEYKLYSNHFPNLRDEGMMACMPYKGGIQPSGTKEGV